MIKNAFYRFVEAVLEEYDYCKIEKDILIRNFYVCRRRKISIK